MASIKELWHLHPPETLANVLGLDPIVSDKYSDNDVLMGAELEIESARHIRAPEGIIITDDNSLRNNGFEFITLPGTIGHQEYVLNQLFTNNKITDANYSERTSVHVHSNCQDLDKNQVASIALLYQVLEPLLYTYAGADRDKNIFCVPWCETNIGYKSVIQMTDNHTMMRHWQKYTGLNLQPLCDKGTIEWRHLPGTNDVNFIINWMNIIGCFYKWVKARSSPVKSLEETKDFILNLNTTSQYTEVVDEIFGVWAELLKCDNYKNLMEEGVIHAKYSLLKEKDEPKKTEVNGEEVWTLVPRQQEVMWTSSIPGSRIQPHIWNMWENVGVMPPDTVGTPPVPRFNTRLLRPQDQDIRNYLTRGVDFDGNRMTEELSVFSWFNVGAGRDFLRQMFETTVVMTYGAFYDTPGLSDRVTWEQYLEALEKLMEEDAPF